MFAMILRSHWSWTRMPVLGIALIAFLIPAVAWRLTSAVSWSSEQALLGSQATLSPLLTIFSLVSAFILAVYPWQLDAETKHAYPLSLPVTWRRYVSMRYLAGALTLTLPALALFLGGHLAVSTYELPPLLKAYPGALALRFLLALLVGYSFSFALQYLAGRRSTIVALVLILVVAGLLTGLSLFGAHGMAGKIGAFLFDAPGPFGIFTQPWVLIDV